MCGITPWQIIPKILNSQTSIIIKKGIMNLSYLRKLVAINKIQRKHKLVLSSILLSVSLIASAFLFVYLMPVSYAVYDSAWPPHSHEGWPIQKTTSYTYSYTYHLQNELNYLNAWLPGYNITDLTRDGVYGTNTKNAVMTYQSLRTLTVDGIVGNQTWTYLEYDVFQTWPTYYHPLTVGFRYPIYSVCKKVTNNAAAHFLVPVATQAEWDAFNTYAPAIGATIVNGNCDVSGGGGSGGGEPGGGGGGWTATSCSNMWSGCCPSECTSAGWACTGNMC